MVKISLITSLGEKTRAIGKNGALLWHIPEDLKRFKTLTMGHPIIMGRKTFDSIGRPLPGRKNIVITRDPDWRSDGVTAASSLTDALDIAKEDETEEIFVIGGGQIFEAALPMADRLYLTAVDDDAPGDTFFPPFRTEFAHTVEEVPGSYNGLSFIYLTLERNHEKARSTDEEKAPDHEAL